MRTTSTKFKPILFSTDMVQAILEDRKTQTRRPLKKIPNLSSDIDWAGKFLKENKHARLFFCPYGKPGDVLWVRETFAIQKYFNGLAENTCTIYKADFNDGPVDWNWKPSIYMPKEACRLFLELTDVRVERLQDITEINAIEEGVKVLQVWPEAPEKIFYKDYMRPKLEENTTGVQDPIFSYGTLWESIHELGSFSKNPWVWVIEFKQIDQPQDFLINNNP